MDAIYRAKVSSHVANGGIEVLIPQVYQELPVPLADYIGPKPTVGSMGFVAFLSGEVSWPVWLGSANLMA